MPGQLSSDLGAYLEPYNRIDVADEQKLIETVNKKFPERLTEGGVFTPTDEQVSLQSRQLLRIGHVRRESKT